MCRLPVSWFLRWPHDWCATLDHRVPISEGGPHLASNVQLAHWTCNQWKAAMGPARFAQALVDVGLEEWERGMALA